MSESGCGRCNNHTARQIIKLTMWFTLFFIPIIPYSKRYLLVCPICGQAQELTKPEFDSLTGVFNNSKTPFDQQPAYSSDDIKYAGKTPTQIAFLKHMESLNMKDNPEQEQN